jgi:hypothetical protein
LIVCRIEIGQGKLNYIIPWLPWLKFRNKEFLKILKKIMKFAKKLGICFQLIMSPVEPIEFPYEYNIHYGLAYIPKEMNENIRKKNFKFIWTSKMERDGIPLVKWQVIAKPKEVGGCIFLYVMWRPHGGDVVEVMLNSMVAGPQWQQMAWW